MAREKRGAKEKKKANKPQEEILIPVTPMNTPPIECEGKTYRMVMMPGIIPNVTPQLVEEGRVIERAIEGSLLKINNSSAEEIEPNESEAETAFKKLMGQLEKATIQEERDALIRAYDACFGNMQNAKKSQAGLAAIMGLGLKRICNNFVHFLANLVSFKGWVASFLGYALLLLFSPATFFRKGDEAGFDWDGAVPPKHFCLVLIWPLLCTIVGLISAKLHPIIILIPILTALFGWIYESGMKEVGGSEEKKNG